MGDKSGVCLKERVRIFCFLTSTICWLPGTTHAQLFLLVHPMVMYYCYFYDDYLAIVLTLTLFNRLNFM